MGQSLSTQTKVIIVGVGAVALLAVIYFKNKATASNPTTALNANPVTSSTGAVLVTSPVPLAGGSISVPYYGVQSNGTNSATPLSAIQNSNAMGRPI